MFKNYRIIKINKYVDGRKNKNDAIAVYDVDQLQPNLNLFKKALNNRKIPFKYFNGANTDKLFIGVPLSNYVLKNKFIKFVRAYNGYIGLTKSERATLNNIRKGYYLSKKYLNESIKDHEYGLYEPIDNYSNYWDNKACSDWDKLNKGVKYEKRLIWEVFPEFSSYKRMMYGEE